MKYQLTAFKTMYDNQTHRVVEYDGWDAFTSALSAMGKVPGRKDNSVPQISPAIYKKGTTRANKNVAHWGGWCAIDVDSALPEDFVAYVREKARPYKFYAYSTGSSSREKPKMRVVLSLDEYPEGDTIKHLWYAIQQHFSGLNDEQTKDYSRMYYAPAKYEDSYCFEFSGEGKDVCIAEIITRFPYKDPVYISGFVSTLPEPIQRELVKYKRNQLNNTDITWTSWRDCPFFPKGLARQYMTISESGWYHHMYRMLVATAAAATEKGYPITPEEIERLFKEFDREHGNWYERRPLALEANRALNYVYSAT